jgi:hypothetical protein
MEHLRSKVHEDLPLPPTAGAATTTAGAAVPTTAINYAEVVATAVAQGTLSSESAWLMRAVVPKEPNPVIPVDIAALWTAELTYDLLPVATRVKLMYALCCWRYATTDE